MEILYTKFERDEHYKKYQHHLNSLPPLIKEDIFRYKKPSDIVSRVLGKLLLIEGFQKYLDEDNVLGKLKYNTYGKPYLPQSDINFSLSHSGCYVMLAIECKMKVGIDIEEIKDLPIEDFKNAFTDKEWNAIQKSPCPLEQFYILWTKKESSSKADGRGLSIPINDIVVNKNSSQIYKTKWHLSKIDLDPSYMIHVASENKDSIALTKVQFK